MQREYKKHGFFSFVPSHTDSRKKRELWCLKHGESEINCVCRVLEESRKEIKTKGGVEKVVLNGLIADYSAKIPFISWEERAQLVTDTVVQIENAYVKRWKGLATLYIDKKARVRVIDKDIDFPGWAELMKPKKRTIGEIVVCGGAFDVILEGDVVSVSRSEKEGGMILDDGTGAVFLKLREKGEGFLFGTPVKARGNVVPSGKSGYVFIADKVKVKDAMIEEIKSFLSRYT
ncbi:MAG: hypothetical protein N2V75_10275 [Methanophagales archaeon]|nr:hypothetical protein [Methanophagales archaeon]RLG32998.1 MAG: hypothetical protein DRN97_06080 [Methanosarcinales archaeon]